MLNQAASNQKSVTKVLDAPKRSIQIAICIGMWGACLLLIGFLAPRSGASDGLSFLNVARQASWSNPGQWLAAWCSVKIILSSLGVVLLFECLARLMMMCRRPALSVTFSFAAWAPGMALLPGIYYLAKAVF